MPPRDPRLCPDLERALPRDDPEPGDPAAEYRRDFTLWEFLFGDGKWHPVTVRAWWLDRHGRTVVQIEWHAGDGTWGESFRFEREKARQA